VSVALVDDQALSAVLRGAVPRTLRRFDLATTGYWYVRLCQAVLSASERSGALSGPFAHLPAAMRDRAIDGLLELPDNIGLVSLRDLAPAIGRLRARHSLNILGMEVLAAADRLDARVFLSVPSPRLQAALAEEGRTCRVLA
jgi:hypothetical protein